MPTVTLQSIDSFSSEDPNFPASNLLSKDSSTTRRWKCRDTGEKSAHVVFRLEKPVQINGIDIGNEHAAFVEVLVGRSGPATVEFKEILLTSSFMSPIESRNSTNTGRVRCFTAKELVESVAKERWDLVKVICTQPFNSRVQYGVAFVTLHSAGEKKEKSLVPEAFQKKIQEEVAAAKKPEPSKVLQLGRFKLREESPDSDESSTSAAGLFARWKASRSGDSDPKPVASTSKPATTPARPTSTAAAIRDASTPAAIRNSLDSPAQPTKIQKITPKVKPRLFDDDDDDVDREGPKVKPRDRNRDALLYDKDDDKPNEKLERKLAEDRARKQREIDAKKEKDRKDRSFTEKKQNLHDTSASMFKNFLFDEPEPKFSSSKDPPKRVEKDPPKKTTSNDVKDRSRDREKSPEERKKRPKDSSPSRERTTSATEEAKKPKLDEREEEEEKPKNPVTYKPFNKLLEKVVLVISGIQNPDRANLRNQALAMGAKYKSDWDSSCTHLICAFKNTPKYNQVHGHGKIVRKEWIERCHALRKRLSWRKFALDSTDAERTDSEGEIVDETRRPKPDQSQQGKASPVRKVASPPPPVRQETDEEALAHYDLDDVEIVDDKPSPTYELSGSDTEEEIERVRQKQRLQIKEKDKENGGGMYDKSTEDEENGGNGKETELDFFKRKRFLIDEDVGAVDLIKLERYVELYKGTLTKSAAEADYVVTRNPKPLPASFKGELVKPLWVYECHDMECWIPTHRYKP